MKTKSIIVALLLALVLALSAFAACDKQGAEHKSDGVYQSDDVYHWHACGECSLLVAEKESYTLYAELVVPQGKAVVMCLREFGSTRAIDLCYLRDVGGTFRTSILGETYPLIEVDGTAITDGSHPEITCSESRIYIVVSKVR